MKLRHKSLGKLFDVVDCFLRDNWWLGVMFLGIFKWEWGLGGQFLGFETSSLKMDWSVA